MSDTTRAKRSSKKGHKRTASLVFVLLLALLLFVLIVMFINSRKPGFLAQRPGDRHIVNEMKSKIWGGKRTKKEVCAVLFSDMEDLHKDLLQLVEKE